MNIHYLQHVPFEDLGSMAAWAHKRDHHRFSQTAEDMLADEQRFTGINAVMEQVLYGLARE